MPTYQAPVRDTLFVLNDVLKVGDYASIPGFEGATPDVVPAILEEAGKFAAEVLFPLNQNSDRQGCRRNPDGSVTTPDGFRDAYARYVDGGWPTLHAPAELGGQGLPNFLSFAANEYVISANQGFELFPGLTTGAIGALRARGSDELQATYLPRMVSGEWTGTMNLTEPHCGTDLGLIKTKAVPNDDGTWAITGNKIFISAGEHDLTSNIIHLVLAKTPGAPEGTKGISLFLVPKFLLDAEGNPGERNAVSCGAIEHKMGLHGSPTCQMNYDGAKGWLVGEENKGLAAMFIMMNAARLGVGLQGLGQAEVAYQNAVAYALDRRQGRALSGPAEPDKPADLLVVHADVRRMLMEGRALTEGLRALFLFAALQVDLAERAPDEESRQQADDFVQLLTPVLKGYGTDKGFDVAVTCQQVFGGHGYIVEWGVEQYVRDARIAQIYEGTNGIQAMDLVGRKLPMNGGRSVQLFFATIAKDIAAAKGHATLDPLAQALEKAMGQLQAATLWLMQNALAKPDHAGAGATAYMHMTGIVALGWMWLRMASVAASGLEAGTGDADWLNAKIITARFFVDRFLPDVGALRRKIEAGSDSTMALPAALFAQR